MNLDTEHDLLRRLTNLRAEVADKVGEAAASRDVAALRAAIGAIFEAVYLRPSDHSITALEGYMEGVEGVEDRPLYVEPHLRPELIEVGENAEPIFERVPLRLEQAGNNLTGSGVPE